MRAQSLVYQQKVLLSILLEGIQQNYDVFVGFLFLCCDVSLLLVFHTGCSQVMLNL